MVRCKVERQYSNSVILPCRFMAKTKSEETVRSQIHPRKPILKKGSKGEVLPAEPEAPSLMSSTYSDCVPSPSPSDASPRGLTNERSESTVDERREKPAATDESDCEDWVAESVLNLVSSLRDDPLLQGYRKFIRTTLDQEWELLPARHESANSEHPRTTFFFYTAPLEVMGVGIPFMGFQKDVLVHLQVAPSQLSPNAWGYLRAFETVMEFLENEASKRVFFCFFLVMRPIEEKSEFWASSVKNYIFFYRC